MTAAGHEVTPGADPSDATAAFCPCWPNEVNGEGHFMGSSKPAGSPVWVRRCDFCGWIDGEYLAEQVAKIDAAGYRRAVDRLRALKTVRGPAKWFDVDTAAHHANYLEAVDQDAPSARQEPPPAAEPRGLAPVETPEAVRGAEGVQRFMAEEGALDEIYQRKYAHWTEGL